MSWSSTTTRDGARNGRDKDERQTSAKAATARAVRRKISEARGKVMHKLVEENLAEVLASILAKVLENNMAEDMGKVPTCNNSTCEHMRVNRYVLTLLMCRVFFHKNYESVEKIAK